jgi:electron transport complex protein RnfC
VSPAGKSVLKAFPFPRALALPLGGRVPAVGIRRGRLVSRGEALARAQGQGVPDLVAPLPGKVTRVSASFVGLEVDLDLGVQAPALDLGPMAPLEARDALLRLGIRAPRAPRPGEPVLVSGFDPEPGMNLSAALLGDQRGTLEAGLRLVRGLFPGKAVLQALPPGESPLGPPGSTAVSPKARYPHTLPAFLRMRLQKGSPYDRHASGVVGLRDLWLLGRALQSGLAPIARPLSIQGVPAMAPPGLSASGLLALVNARPLPGDRVVLGGLARGLCASDLDLGLGQDLEAVSLLRARGAAPPRPRPCTLCGRCREACPLGLPCHILGLAPLGSWPDLLRSREDLASCPACGLCAAVCPSFLPLASLRGPSLAGDQPC